MVHPIRRRMYSSKPLSERTKLRLGIVFLALCALGYGIAIGIYISDTFLFEDLAKRHTTPTTPGLQHELPDNAEDLPRDIKHTKHPLK